MVLGLFEVRDRGCSNYAACMSHLSCRGRLGSVFVMRRQLPPWLDVKNMMRRRRPSNRAMHQYRGSTASPGPGQLLLSNAKPDMMVSRFPRQANASWSDTRDCYDTPSWAMQRKCALCPCAAQLSARQSRSPGSDRVSKAEVTRTPSVVCSFEIGKGSDPNIVRQIRR